jgi:hypothetical protein
MSECGRSRCEQCKRAVCGLINMGDKMLCAEGNCYSQPSISPEQVFNNANCINKAREEAHAEIAQLRETVRTLIDANDAQADQIDKLQQENERLLEEINSKNRLLPSLLAEGKQIETQRAMLAEVRVTELQQENERLKAICPTRGRCFPNPLQLDVDSHILVSHFTDTDGACGVLFQDTGKEHKTGELYPDAMLELPHAPQQGELYIRFRSPQSAVVVLEALTQAICSLLGFQNRASVEAQIKENPCAT